MNSDYPIHNPNSTIPNPNYTVGVSTKLSITLYGDVDAAIAAGPFAALGRESLRDRAEHLYKQLTAE